MPRYFGFYTDLRHVRLAYQLPASSTFLSKQISYHQPANGTFPSEQTNTSRQPPAKRTVWEIFLPVSENTACTCCRFPRTSP
jgi:hypothetical protein